MKSFHVKGYVFAGEIRCCDCIANWAEEKLKTQGYYSKDIENIASLGPDYDSGVYAWRSESFLEFLAELKNIDYEDMSSWDSDDFPKVVFADQIEEKEYCGVCLKGIS